MPDADDGVQESSEEFEELLRSQNLSEIQEEVENLNFLLLKLREKLHKAQVSGRRAGSQTGGHDGMVAEEVGRPMALVFVWWLLSAGSHDGRVGGAELPPRAAEGRGCHGEAHGEGREVREGRR